MTRIKVGLIGTGKHGSRYAHHLVHDLCEYFQLVAISRRGDEGRAQAAAWHTTYFADWRALVASKDVEAVISVTTPNLNPDIGKHCVLFKKPLLLEKPLTTDYYQASDLVERFAQGGVGLTIAQTLRYNSVINALRNLLPSIGRLHYFTASQRLEPSTLAWLEQPAVAGGGVIFHTGVHLVDALRYITGDEIVAVRATTRKVYNPYLEDVLIAEVALHQGCVGLIDTSKVSPSRLSRYEFVGEAGQLLGDQIYGLLQKVVGMDVTSLPVASPGPTLLPLLREWHSFLTAAGDNPIRPQEGLAAVKICHALRAAAGTTGWVDLADL
jgi:predicted dehydrogenase